MFENKSTIEEKLQALKNIKLKGEEKFRVRGELLSFIKSHPVREKASLRYQSYTQRPFWSLIIKNPYLKTMPIAILIALILGGSFSYAAEGSLPGSPLYPIKVGINEEVRGWFTVSEEAKARWESRRLERRLEEAEELALNGEISAEVKAKIEENFERHAEKVKSRIEEFESRNDFEAAADVSSNFETSLSAHEKILSGLLEDRKEASTSVRSLLEKVREQGKDAERKREKNEAEVSGESSVEVSAAAEGRMEAAENKIIEVRKFIERLREILGAEATLKAEARLKIAEGLVAEGKTKLEAGAFGEAFVFFQKAHRVAQEAKLLIEARKDLEINVRINGGVDVKSETEKQEGDELNRKENENIDRNEDSLSSGSNKEERTDKSDDEVKTGVKGGVKINLGF